MRAGQPPRRAGGPRCVDSLFFYNSDTPLSLQKKLTCRLLFPPPPRHRQQVRRPRSCRTTCVVDHTSRPASLRLGPGPGGPQASVHAHDCARAGAHGCTPARAIVTAHLKNRPEDGDAHALRTAHPSRGRAGLEEVLIRHCNRWADGLPPRAGKQIGRLFFPFNLHSSLSYTVFNTITPTPMPRLVSLLFLSALGGALGASEYSSKTGDGVQVRLFCAQHGKSREGVCGSSLLCAHTRCHPVCEEGGGAHQPHAARMSTTLLAPIFMSVYTAGRHP